MAQESTHPHHKATVIVIGGGQAGLSAGYHLQERGYTNALLNPGDPLTYIILDAAEGPGGAWRHRWESLTMSTVNQTFDLPGHQQPPVSPDTPSRIAVPAYFASFEAAHRLALARGVTVLSVKRSSPGGDSRFILTTTQGIWAAQALINATGTWNNPLIPAYQGQGNFTGRQLHTRDHSSHQEFTGQRVAIVGGGISAIQHLEEISRVAETFWYTRRKPVFLTGSLSPELGREAVAKVQAATEAGIPTGSVVSYTGLPWAPYVQVAQERGVLVRRPMFTALTAKGVQEADSSLTPLDTILWATGFKPALFHLAPLNLDNEQGAITMQATQVASEDRLHLIGYGPSQSTVGAHRAGREAVRQLHRLLSSQS